MDIGIVSDELHSELEEAFRQGKALGIENFELRNIGGKRIPRINDEEIKRTVELVKKYDVNISALSPGLFKIANDDHEKLELHTGTLMEKTFQLGDMLGTKKIIIFSFVKEEDAGEMPEEVIENLKKAADRAKKQGFILLLENEAGCWGDTALNTLSLLEAVKNPALRLNWDPGNACKAGGTPFPDGYDLIRDWVDNVHLKDFRPGKSGGSGHWTTADSGIIDWKGQIKALHRDQYGGLITIENHCRPLSESTRRNFDFLKKVLHELPD